MNTDITPPQLPDIVIDDNPQLLALDPSTLSGGNILRPGLSDIENPAEADRIPYEKYYHVHLSSAHADKLLRDEDGTELTSGFEIFLDDPIMADDETDLFISLESATIPISWYNVTPTDSRIQWSETITGSQDTFYMETNIEPGNYDIGDLCTEIGNKMTRESADHGLVLTYVLTYLPRSRKIKIVADARAAFIVSLDYTVSIFFTNEMSIARLVGFPHDTTINLVSLGIITPIHSGSAVGTRIVDLRGTPDVWIHTNFALPNVRHPRTTSRSDALCKIHIDDDAFERKGYFHFDNTGSSFRSPMLSGMIKQLVIRLTDRYGMLIDLNGVDWSLTLLITQRKTWYQKN